VRGDGEKKVREEWSEGKKERRNGCEKSKMVCERKTTSDRKKESEKKRKRKKKGWPPGSWKKRTGRQTNKADEEVVMVMVGRWFTQYKTTFCSPFCETRRV